jgi:hypothetical protein
MFFKIVLMGLYFERISFEEFASLISKAVEREMAPVKEYLATTNEVIISRKVAAEILDVTPVTINNYVSYGSLKPVFKAGSTHMNYKLSEVLSIKNQHNKFSRT